MADGGLEGLFSSLDAAFDAALAREEEEAAADLALSMRQGHALADVLARGNWMARLPSAAFVPISLVGRDFLLGASQGDVLVPLGRAEVVRGGDGPKPNRTDMTMLEVLRRAARTGSSIEVVAISTTHLGVLEWAGTDHVALRTPTTEVLVASGLVQVVRFPEGLKDVLV